MPCLILLLRKLIWGWEEVRRPPGLLPRSQAVGEELGTPASHQGPTAPTSPVLPLEPGSETPPHPTPS